MGPAFAKFSDILTFPLPCTTGDRKDLVIPLGVVQTSYTVPKKSRNNKAKTRSLGLVEFQ